KQDDVGETARSTLVGFGQQREVRVVAECNTHARKETRQIQPVEIAPIGHPPAGRPDGKPRHRDSQTLDAMLIEETADKPLEGPAILRRRACEKRPDGCRLTRFGQPCPDIRATEIDGERPAHPFTPELTMLSTKKRCRKTNMTSGGRTASVAPAITSPVFSAPRL